MECNICLEPFDATERRPKVLRCGHSYCVKCLGRLADKKCPVDMKVFDGEAVELPDCFIVLQNLQVPLPQRFWCISCEKEADAACVEDHPVRSLRKARVQEAAPRVEALQQVEATLEEMVDAVDAAARGAARDLCETLRGKQQRLAAVRGRLQATLGAEAATWEQAKKDAEVEAELEPWNPDLWKFLGALRVTLACENQARGGLLRNLQSDHSPLENFLESADQMRISAILMVHYRTFNKDCDAAVSWIRDVAGLKWLSAEAVRRGAGICFINSNSCSAGLGRKETAVFAGMSLLEHSCRPNTDVLVWQREDGPAPDAGSTEYVLVASRNIARGEHLTLAYLHSFLLGSVKRRAQTLGWNFLCQCELCRDPSQRGLHLEAWCCAACSGKKKKAFPVTIHDMQNSWSCSGCGETGSLDGSGGGAQGAQAQAKRLEKRLENYVGSTAKVPLKEWEQFIHDALWPRGPLHPTHSLVLQAKKAIVELDGVLVLKATLTPAESRRVAAYCRDLLAVSDVVCPGVNWFRQQLLLVLAGVVEGLVEAQMESMRTMRPPRALEKLLDEMEEIHTELTRIAVSPKHKKTSLGNLEEIAATRNAFSVFK